MLGTIILEFVPIRNIETRVEEFDQEKLPGLHDLKYPALGDATEKLGSIPQIQQLFMTFRSTCTTSRG